MWLPSQPQAAGPREERVGQGRTAGPLIKKTKRVGHGFRTLDDYRLRLLLTVGPDWRTVHLQAAPATPIRVLVAQRHTRTDLAPKRRCASRARLLSQAGNVTGLLEAADKALYTAEAIGRAPAAPADGVARPVQH